MFTIGTLIAKDDTWILWAIIIVWATVSIFLEQKYQWASTISGAIIALVGAMLLSNFKIIPLNRRFMIQYGITRYQYQFLYYCSVLIF